MLCVLPSLSFVLSLSLLHPQRCKVLTLVDSHEQEILFRKTELSLQSTTLQLQLLQVNSDYRAMANSSAENDQIIAEKTREKDLGAFSFFILYLV